MIEIKDAFAKEFKRCLIAHYGKVPSCARIAKDFTLISRELDPISVETVRKWLLGINLPHSARLRTLVLWLNLNIGVIDKALTSIGQHTDTKPKDFKRDDPSEEKLIRIFQALDKNDQEKVLKIAELYSSSFTHKE